MNSIGLHEASAGVKEYIAAELKKFSESHPKIESNSLLKLRELVKRLNKQIADCAVTVDGQDVSKFAADKAKIKIAPCLREQMWTYTATASATVNGKTVKEFGIETIG